MAYLEERDIPWWQNRVANPITDYSADKLPTGSVRLDSAVDVELTSQHARRHGPGRSGEEQNVGRVRPTHGNRQPLVASVLLQNYQADELQGRVPAHSMSTSSLALPPRAPDPPRPAPDPHAVVNEATVAAANAAAARARERQQPQAPAARAAARRRRCTTRRG